MRINLITRKNHVLLSPSTGMYYTPYHKDVWPRLWTKYTWQAEHYTKSEANKIALALAADDIIAVPVKD